MSKSNNKEPTPIQEYVIRVPPKTNKKYNVMRFNAANNVDFSTWKNVKLDREFSLKEFKAAAEEEIPKFGAGSEFGLEQREESRKKRYQKYASRHRPDDQPWVLNVRTNKPSGSNNKSRKFKGIREGGVTDNTSYYVFFQAHDGAFEAFPVSEWYNFAPIPRYKALTAEEAEEQFEKRDKILNFFSVMSSKKKTDLNDSMEDGFKPRKSKGFKTSDMDDWGGIGSDGSGDDSDNKTKGKKGKREKKESDDDRDSEPHEESDEGDFDTREVDYMSDSSSDDDDDVEKLNRELKGVEDEDALRQLVLSDEEEEKDEKSKEDTENTNNSQLSNAANDNKNNESEAKIKQEKKSSNSDSSDSSDSDIDDNKFQSSIFMQKSNKAKKEVSQESNSSKRKIENDNNPSTSSSKKPKVISDSGINEETVKRYLMRKPITTTELLKNLKKMKCSNSGDELVNKISQILKKLNPQRQTIANKLYLYMKPE